MHRVILACNPVPLPPHRPSWVVTGLTALAVGAGFEVEAWLGARIGLPGATVPLFDLPGAFFLGALLLSPIRAWWVIGLAALSGVGAARLQADATPELVLLGFLSKAIPVALAAFGLRCWTGTPVRLDDLRKVVGFLVLAVLGVPLVGSFVESALGVSNGWGDDDWRPYGVAVLAGAVSILAVVPVLAAVVARVVAGFRGVSPARVVEAWVVALLLLASGAVALEQPRTGSWPLPPLLLAPLPALLWAALRFGPSGVGLALLALSGFAIEAAGRGRGPFRGSSPVEETLSLQLVLLAVGVPCLLLAAHVRHRRRVRLAHSARARAETRHADLAAVLAILPGRPNDLEIIQGLHQRIADLLEVAGSELVQFEEETVALPARALDPDCPPETTAGGASDPTAPVIIHRSTSVAIVSGSYSGPRDGPLPLIPPVRHAGAPLARDDSRTALVTHEEHFRLQSDSAAARIYVIPQDPIQTSDDAPTHSPGNPVGPRALVSVSGAGSGSSQPALDRPGLAYCTHQKFLFELHLQRQDGECRWVRILGETRIAARILTAPRNPVESRPTDPGAGPFHPAP